MNTPGWTETPNGLVVPPSLKGSSTPEFERFMLALGAHLPELQDWVSKSIASAKPRTVPADGLDYMSMWQGVKTRDSVSGLSDEMLRQMARRCPPVAALIHTRCDEVGNYCKLPESETDVGFRIATRDSDHKPSAEEREEIRRLEEMILECGLPDANPVKTESTFDEWARKEVRDSLTMDAAVFEIIPGANAEKYPVVAFKAVDPAEINIVSAGLINLAAAEAIWRFSGVKWLMR